MRKLENGNIVLETSTNVWPIVCVGTYDGQPCDYNTLFGDEIEDSSDWLTGCGQHVVYADDFDFGKWKDAVLTELNKLLDGEFPAPADRFGVWIGPVRATEIKSPREYNFSTDCAMLDVEVKPDFAGKALARLSDARDDEGLRRRMDNWITGHWRSRDGFVSFMPESWNEFMEEMLQLDACMNGGSDAEPLREAQTAGAALTLLLVCSEAYRERERGLDFGWRDEVDLFSDDLYENLVSNHSPGDFQSSWLFSDLSEKLAAVGVRTIDFREEAADMGRRIDATAEASGMPEDEAGELRRGNWASLRRAAETQDMLLAEFALSAPSSQKEFNAIGRLRKFIEGYKKGE